MNRLIFPFLLIIVFTLNVIGQTSILHKKVSVDQDNSTIEEVLNELKVVYDIKFSYVNNLIPLQNTVSIHASEQPLSLVLTEIFKSTDVSYSLVDSQIVLTVRSEQEDQSVHQADIDTVNIQDPTKE